MSQEKTCYQCKETVKKGARTCPYCNEKFLWPRFKDMVFLIVVLIVIAAITSFVFF
jgi:RNA polymerase subunit RPABC4/transcription elongation factor Spt4